MGDGRAVALGRSRGRFVLGRREQVTAGVDDLAVDIARKLEAKRGRQGGPLKCRQLNI
jgi:hypothetical protein